VRPRTVTGDGEGIVSHAGLVWLGEVADAVGLTAGMRHATRQLEWRKHQPGVALMHMALGLADGATCVSDLAALRDQQRLFGPVASHPTAWRAFNRLGPVELRGIDAAIARARSAAWTVNTGDDNADGFVIDLDATLVTTRTDKQDAAPTYKRTYGHHPLLAMCAQRGEILAAKLRPGNAGSNTAEDHVVVLGAAINALPDMMRSGHNNGDNPESVNTAMLVRSDSAGASHWLADECRDRQFAEDVLVVGDLRALVPRVERHRRVESGVAGAELRGGYVASSDFVGEDELQELVVRELLLRSEGEPLGQGVEAAAELHAAQQALEFRGDNGGVHALTVPEPSVSGAATEPRDPDANSVGFRAKRAGRSCP